MVARLEYPALPAFVDVVLPMPVDRAFTYAVPEALQEGISPGMRVLAPVKKRIEMGFVVGVHESCEVAEPRAILDAPDLEPVFTDEMLRLCRWMADYYCCSWGEALQAAVPRGLRMRVKAKYALRLENAGGGRFSERQKRIVAALHARGPLSIHQLAKEAGSQGLEATLQTLIKREVVRVEASAAKASVNIHTVAWAKLCHETIPDAAGIESMQRRAPKQAAVYLDLLHGVPERPVSELYARHGATAATLKTLEDKGLIAREERELYRAPDMDGDASHATKFPLNDEQQDAYDAITDAMESQRFESFLLRGITGSGKTEVYLQAMERLLELGRDAIILVPEISLTPQTVGRFKGRFKEDIAVLHSGLGAGERFDEWRRAQRGEVRIVVGARSAVFAPLKNLGAIVVDEEHDTSYKQGETPRYHARDVAVMRAKLNNAVCVLGSATPSIETYYNARSRKYTGLELSRRATDAALPKVQIIDMREESIAVSGEVVLSRHLEEAVRQRVAKKEQVILLLNRRGFSPYVLCPSCGWVAECEDCNVSMTYHQRGGVLKCHYCKAQRGVPAVCDKCGFHPLLFLGQGTQKAEDYLMRSFPGARVQRMDADTTSEKGGHANILGRFAAGEIDILIGTQMIAKGHDYPGVTLVGVINGDTGLSLPDFRASEQTFQLLTQVAGRAGRGGLPGEVMIQTFRPKHFAIQCAAHHDYLAFAGKELDDRHKAGYPPYRRLANLMVESADPESAERATMHLFRVARHQIRQLELRGVDMLGPSPALVSRVMGKYRWNFGLLVRGSGPLNKLVRAARDAFEEDRPPGTYTIRVDLDPYGAY